MKHLALILALILPAFLFSQEVEENLSDPGYEWRIRQEILFNVYIPKDVNEAFAQLNKLIDADSKATFKVQPEDEAAKKLFFSFGRWMTYNWSLYEGSRLSVHLQSLGIHHPDDMARFLIISYHRSLNRKPLEIKTLIQQFQEKAELEKQERLKKGTILKEEKRKVAAPPGKGN